MIWYIVLLTFLSCLRFTFQYRCLENCSCRLLEDLQMLACVRLSLNQFPDRIDNSTQFLRLEKNQITAVPQNLSALLPDLVRIDISDNKINKLHPNAFEKFSHLESLLLQKNKISTIQNDIFMGLDSITMNLRLQNNNISFIHSNAFRGLLADTTLDLSHNKISSLHPNTFLDVRGLHNLNLADNQLAELPGMLFRNQENMFYLNLHNNLLTTLNAALFKGVTALETLDLSYNRLESIPKSVFVTNKQLKTLNLVSNKLKYPPTGLPSNVEHINLQSNPLHCDCHLKKILSDEISLVWKIPDFKSMICVNHGNKTTEQILNTLNCETTTASAINTTMLPVTLTMASNNNKSDVTKGTPTPTNKTKEKVIFMVVIIVVVTLFIVAPFVWLYRKSLWKTGHRTYQLYKSSERRPKVPRVFHTPPEMSESYRQQQLEGWDGTSHAVYRKNEGDI